MAELVSRKELGWSEEVTVKSPVSVVVLVVLVVVGRDARFNGGGRKKKLIGEIDVG